MLRIPRFAPPGTRNVLAAFAHPQTRNASHSSFRAARDASRPGPFRTLKLGMLRIPRFGRPGTLRVLAALRKSAKDVRRASSPVCFCGFAQGADNYKIIPFSGRRLQPQPGSAFRGLPHPGRLRTPKEHNASWSPFGARPTRSTSAPRRNTMLPGRPSGPAPPRTPPPPEGTQCFLVALRGPPHSGRFRAPKNRAITQLTFHFPCSISPTFAMHEVAAGNKLSPCIIISSPCRYTLNRRDQTAFSVY